MSNEALAANCAFVTHNEPFSYKYGQMTATRTSAWTGPGCHLGCGVILHTDAKGELIKVEGDPDNPFNHGRLCVRCLALPEVVHHHNRLITPLKRDPSKRGEDAWEPISWEDAFEIIAANFIEYREQFGSETVMFWQGTGRDIAPWITRLAWSYGSPNYVVALSGTACYAPRIAGCRVSSGAFWVGDYSQQFADRYKNPSWRLPEVILVWGNNPVVSNSDGLYGHWIVDCLKRGSALITVDPKRTWIANKSEIFLQLRPGTDAALAMGLLNVMITEELYDQEFVDLWCYGFDELAQRVSEFTPNKVSGITWVPPEMIIAAARLFAKATSAIVQWGVAVDMTKETLPAGQAISALFEITGNIDNPGGMIKPPSILYYAAGWGRELISEEERQAKKIGNTTYPLFRAAMGPASTDECINTLETDTPYKLRAAWLQTTNPLVCTGPDPRRTLAALKKLEFIVCVDLFMTPTAMALADILLPAATFPERNGIRVGDGVQRAESINKVTTVGECKSDMEINLEVGRRLNPQAWPWQTVEEMYDFILKDTGMSFVELQQKAPGYLPFEYYKYKKGLLRPDGEVGFATGTGRIELWSTLYAQVGLDPLPYFEEPMPGPISTPELYKEYPLILTTGARRLGLFHSEHRQIPHLRALHPEPLLEIHPNTAADLGLVTGDWVWVENNLGRAKRRVYLTEALDPRVCSTDHAWWYPEAPSQMQDGLFGLWDLNINQLITWQPGKSGLGSNYKTLLCKVYKIKEGE
jgi:anaerobic selenocysteine-containing dehydrogenase